MLQVASPTQMKMMEDQKVTEDQLDEQDTEIMSESRSTSRSRSETPINEKKGTPTGKRKRSVNDKFDGVVDKLIKMQEETDRNYVKLEEKLLEMEERRQRESQDFQLKMMAILRGHQSTGTSYGASQYGPASYGYSYTHQEDKQY